MVGIVHAGRQGTQLKILEKSLKFIFRLSGVKPHSLLLIFGPCICRKCYGVDLRAENLNQALQAGIPKKNIYQSNLCTVCHPELFFSYRKTHTPRRMMNVVMMKK